MLGISQNRFEENQFSLDDLYSALLKGCSVASMNCGGVRCGPFILSQLKVEEDIRGIGVSLIIVIPVKDAGGCYEKVSLNRVALSTFYIGDNIKDGVSLCRLILELERHSPF